MKNDVELKKDVQYARFLESINSLHDKALKARGKAQMYKVLDDTKALFNGFLDSEVDAMPFNVKWWVLYYRRDGLNFYRTGLKENYEGPNRWKPGVPTKKIDNLFGLADDLSRLARELKKIIEE